MQTEKENVYFQELGMAFTTACARLKKKILFDLIKKVNMDTCYRCGKLIEEAGDLGIDHKEPWLHIDSKLFWNLDNVCFSHVKCNNIKEKHFKKNCSPLIDNE